MKQVVSVAGTSFALFSEAAQAESLASTAPEKIDYMDYFINELVDGIQVLHWIAKS